MVIELPQGLYEKVIGRLRTEKRKRAIIRMFLSGSATLASLAGVFFALQYAFQQMMQTGFFNYFSLIFSDLGSLSIFWKEFSLLLMESAPITAIAIFLGAILILLESIKYLYLYEQRFSSFKSI